MPIRSVGVPARHHRPLISRRWSPSSHRGRPLKEWIRDDDPGLNWFNHERNPSGAVPECFDQCPAGQPKEVPLGDGRILIIDDS